MAKAAGKQESYPKQVLLTGPCRIAGDYYPSGAPVSADAGLYAELVERNLIAQPAAIIENTGNNEVAT